MLERPIDLFCTLGFGGMSLVIGIVMVFYGVIVKKFEVGTRAFRVGSVAETILLTPLLCVFFDFMNVHENDGNATEIWGIEWVLLLFLIFVFMYTFAKKKTPGEAKAIASATE